MSTMPRPKEEGTYNDGTYEWYWDGEEWQLDSAAPSGMPSYPDRKRLRRVRKSLEPLTDEDFEPEEEFITTRSGCQITVTPSTELNTEWEKRWGPGHLVALSVPQTGQRAEVYLDHESEQALTVALGTSETLEQTMERLLGATPRYLLCKHPAWPDPLDIWPPTAEHARKVFEENPHPDAYVLRTWDPPRDVFIPARKDSSNV